MERERPAEDESLDDVVAMFNALGRNAFDEIFPDEELARFHHFINSRGEPAGSFVVAWPLADTTAWFHYTIEQVKKRRKKASYTLSLDVFVGNEDHSRDLPEELQGKPIWWLTDPSGAA